LMSGSVLPKDFENLSIFVEEWSLPTSALRRMKRKQSSMDQIKSFYDALFPHFDSALTYLDNIPYTDTMDSKDRNLMNMFLSFAEISTCVEWYNQPDVVDGYDTMLVHMNWELP
jgi:hypothetical protein